jgi:hypothetical protein
VRDGRGEVRAGPGPAERALSWARCRALLAGRWRHHPPGVRLNLVRSSQPAGQRNVHLPKYLYNLLSCSSSYTIWSSRSRAAGTSTCIVS